MKKELKKTLLMRKTKMPSSAIIVKREGKMA